MDRRTTREWDIYFLTLAEHVSMMSKDPSTKTGAVIVRKDRSILSTGYNGFPMGMPEPEKYYTDREEKLSRIIHCEMNALIFAREDLRGCTLYTYPFLSCDRCFSHLAQAGIVRFVAPECRDAALLDRWGATFVSVRERANAMGIEITEY